MSTTQTRSAPDVSTRDDDKWRREQRAFHDLLPELLHTNPGQFVAIREDQVVESGNDRFAVARRAYDRFAYVPIHVHRVAAGPPHAARVPSPRRLEGLDRKSVTLWTLVLALVVSVISTTALAALQAPEPSPSESRVRKLAKSEFAASQALEQPAPSVSTVCVEANGTPVSGAEVHLFQQTGEGNGHYTHSGPFTSGREGKAECGRAIFSNERGNFDRWIYARVPGRLVGVARGAKWTNRAAFNAEGLVKLQASRSIEGQVTVPAGVDPTKVTVRVRAMDIATGPGEFEFQSFPREDLFPGLDTALPELFECRPDAKGRIRLRDIPVRGRLYVVTSAAGLGEAQWSNRGKTFDEPIQLTIEEESVVSGRVVAPDGTALAGIEVKARLSPAGRRHNSYLSTFRAVTDEHGRFAIHGLPQTEFVLSIEDPKKLWTFRPLEDLFVEPHKDPNLTLNVESGVRVSGRVFDPDGKPVEAAGLGAVADTKGGPGLSHGATDSSGRYQLRLPTGSAHLYFNGLPDGFVYPNPQIVKSLELKSGQADIENVDFTLQRRQDKDQ
jgi:hypothetical protein